MLDSIKIGGMEPASMLEREGFISAIVFVMGCNFRCPFCHNPDLLKPDEREIVPYPIKELIRDLNKKKDWIDSVIFTGGEPTIYNELPLLIEKLNKMGFSLGLHTNGTNPSMVDYLIEADLIDYLTMDLKNTELKYPETAGVKKINLEKIKDSIDLIKKAPRKIETVFRTTIVPGLITQEDIDAIGGLIKGARAVSLQQFRPMKCLDKKYEKMKPYEVEILHKMADVLEKYVEEVRREFV
ncbi:MAG: anaerobic ribonucleoside-triphosphate reductase activating protein [Candidatus Moranbacteria bacterium]|nr:anaerobic ribonucleoside-triphosphate reductase activating protein [Candidatus Moranbacteria bacterium]